MSYSIQCRYTTDVSYYKTMAQWLRDAGMAEWRWDDARYRIIFNNEMDALAFKLRWDGDLYENL